MIRIWSSTAILIYVLQVCGRSGPGRLSNTAVALAGSHPAPRKSAYRLRIVLQEGLSRGLDSGQQVRVPHEVGHAHFGEAGLAGTQELTRPAELEVPTRDHEAVVGLADGGEPRARHLGQFAAVEQHAMTLVRAAAHAAAQLVQLRETHALGVLDDHERGVRYVDADFDDGGRD